MDAITFRRLALRTIVLWILVTLAIALLGLLSSLMGGAAVAADAGSPARSSWIGIQPLRVFVTTGLLLLDMRLLNEQRLLANVGIGARTVAAVGSLVGLGLDLALAIARAVVGHGAAAAVGLR